MSNLKKFSVFTLILFFIVSPILNAQVIKDDFRVNDDTTGGDNRAPDVEILESGEAIITWRDSRLGIYNVYGQAYDSIGNLVNANFKVSTEEMMAETYSSISSFGDSLLVIWEEYGYGQWLSPDGSKEGSTFYLNSGNTYGADVGVSDTSFFVVWNRNISGSGYQILLKRFNFDGDSIGSSIVVNDDVTAQNQLYPSISMNNDGNFIVVWEDFRNGSSPDIYGQLFNSSGDTTGLGGNFLVNDDGGSTNQFTPSCAMDSAGNFIVVWSDYRDGDADIYGQRFNITIDTALGSNFPIDQSPGAEDDYMPQVSMNEDNFVVAWERQSIVTTRSVYKRRFENGGTPVGNEVKVNEFDGTANQQDPQVDMNDNGNVVVTWYDNRPNQGINFQRLDALGNTLGANIHLNNGYRPDVAVSEDSSFVISHDYGGYIYYQRFRSSGDSIGSPIIISDTTAGSRNYTSIDIDSDNNAVVVWRDLRLGNRDIYAQMIDSAGDTVGSNFRVNDDVGTEPQYNPTIARSPSGKFLITWYDRRNGDYDIYGQIFDSDGTPVGTISG